MKVSSWDEVVRAIRTVTLTVEDLLPQRDIRSICELIDASEPGIVFENLCAQRHPRTRRRRKRRHRHQHCHPHLQRPLLLRPVPRRLPRANPQAVGPQAPGGPEGFFGGLGSDIIGSAETGACISDLMTCLQYLAAGGEMPSVLYKNWLSSQGVDTSFNSTYGGGEVSGDIIALAIAGAADADTAVGVSADAGEDPVAAEGARSGGLVQIFRNVDAREFDSIATTGKFSGADGRQVVRDAGRARGAVGAVAQRR
jgi:hypothetical protein